MFPVRSRSNSGIVGFIPSELGLFRNLTLIDLSVNSLIGSIPSQIGSCQALQSLSLRVSVNLRICDIWALLLQSNVLSGTIPVELRTLLALTSLDLSYNALTGPLFSALFGPTSSPLQEIIVRSNFLTGSFPSNFNILGRSLKRLDLAFNPISGTIPFLISSLTYLDVSSAQLYGNIMGFFPPYLDVSNNPGLVGDVETIFLFGSTYFNVSDTAVTLPGAALCASITECLRTRINVSLCSKCSGWAYSQFFPRHIWVSKHLTQSCYFFYWILENLGALESCTIGMRQEFRQKIKNF